MKKIIFDATNKTSVEVDMTPEEIAEIEASAAQAAEEQAQREAEEQARLAAQQSAKDKLAALGLSEEEIAAITGA